MALEIKDSNFEELLASGKPVVVDSLIHISEPTRPY